MSVPKTATAALEHLLALTHDGIEGYHHAAAAVADPKVHTFLMQCAASREEIACVLTNLLVELGHKPEQYGSLPGSVHRSWVDLLATVRRASVDAVLRECERGENEALIAFRHALANDLPPAVGGVVQAQFRRVREVARAVHELRLAQPMDGYAS
jgi:uncharacterized protein (TIGR02284 family)